MDWPEIYSRLRADRNDAAAWGELEARVRRWARATLGEHGPDLVEDAVADTCTRVVLDLGAARGAETFAGFTKGKFLNARKAAIAWLRQPIVRLDEDLELASPAAAGSESRWDALYEIWTAAWSACPNGTGWPSSSVTTRMPRRRASHASCR